MYAFEGLSMEIFILLCNFLQVVAAVVICAAITRVHFPFLLFAEEKNPPRRKYEIDPHKYEIDPMTEALTKAGMEAERANQKVDNLSKQFVTKEEFAPVQKVVYGMVGVILVTALASLLILIWKTKP